MTDHQLLSRKQNYKVPYDLVSADLHVPCPSPQHSTFSSALTLRLCLRRSLCQEGCRLSPRRFYGPRGAHFSQARCHSHIFLPHALLPCGLPSHPLLHSLRLSTEHGSLRPQILQKTNHFALSSVYEAFSKKALNRFKAARAPFLSICDGAPVTQFSEDLLSRGLKAAHGLEESRRAHLIENRLIQHPQPDAHSLVHGKMCWATSESSRAFVLLSSCREWADRLLHSELGQRVTKRSSSVPGNPEEEAMSSAAWRPGFAGEILFDSGLSQATGNTLSKARTACRTGAGGRPGGHLKGPKPH